jgi:NAD(P)-dependent dehydrogenase (short-subunit alcohol dehydrogenase family)
VPAYKIDALVRRQNLDRYDDRLNIRVNTIAPGLFLTPLLEGLPPKVQGELAADVPCPQRLGAPDEYAALVEHIATNAYINGTVIRIDGGLRMKA